MSDTAADRRQLAAEFNVFVKVNGDFGIAVYKTLCRDCAGNVPHRVIRLTESDCQECGQKTNTRTPR